MILKLRSKRKGDHVRTQFFVGEDADHFELAGTLVMGVGEWQSHGAALRLGAQQMHGNLSVVFEGDEQVVR